LILLEAAFFEIPCYSLLFPVSGALKRRYSPVNKSIIASCLNILAPFGYSGTTSWASHRAAAFYYFPLFFVLPVTSQLAIYHHANQILSPAGRESSTDK
jgi:hypothetical protein